MRMLTNRLIPFRGFLAVNLFGLLFVRHHNVEKITEKVINHERIHTAQMRELGFLLFYVLYFLEWLFWLIKDRSSAYRRISFEREAYYWQPDVNYLARRRHFAQWRKQR